MKRWQVLGSIGAIGVLGAAGAVYYKWRRAHTLITAHFDVPVAQASVPARLEFVTVATGLEQPTDVQFVPGGGTRALVAEQNGHVRLMDFGPALKGGAPAEAQSSPLALDLTVRAQGEMGLLGFAFHPHYRERGMIYAYYAPWVHDTLVSRIAEFSLPFAELGKSVGSEKRVLLEFPQQFVMHQGGQVAFGPDERLYVGIGDGSTANDPAGRSQDLGSIHGKLLRLDVDGPSLIPADNPFTQRAGARGEIWAYGLRNPWRFSFDAKGRAIVGDVGQEGREEVDMVTSGANLGWNPRQGRLCSNPEKPCPLDGFTEPVHDYDRSVGSCVVGGYQATGTRVPALTGKYVFADFVRGRIWAMPLPEESPKVGVESPPVEPELLGEWPKLFSTFARDSAGDIYVADVVTGEILALVPTDSAP